MLVSIPLVVWMVYSILSLQSASYEELIGWMSQPFNLVASVLFVIVTLTHFTLEIEVVFEDYISDIKRRDLVIKCMKIFFLALGAFTIFSVFKFGI